MKKFLSALGISLLLFGCSTQDNSKENSTPTSDTIKIGGIAPLSGDAASYGLMAQNVANLRVKGINEAGGINGKNLEIIWEDGKCAPGDSSKAAQKLINIDRVSVILGGACSGETLGAAPITEKKKVILFSSLSSSPEVTNAGDFVFRTAPSDSSQGKVLAEYADQYFQRIGIITEQTDYAVGVTNTFESHFSGETTKESFLSSESDFKVRITKLKNEELDALLIVTQTPTKLDIILKQLKEQEWKTPLVANEFLAANADGIATKYSEFLKKNGAVSANFIAPDNEILQAFVSKYEKQFGKKPEYLNYAATTLDGIDILVKVLREVGNETDTEAIRDALYATQDYEGVFGTLSFDENGDVNITHSLFEFDGEEFIPME